MKKCLTKLILMVFILFLATPTIVGMVDQKLDTSYFYNSTEEENHSSYDVIKICCVQTFNYDFFIPSLQLKKTFLLKDDKIDTLFSSLIFLPPPEL